MVFKMPKCGTQVTICDVPIRFDTYKGCSHLCKYCFVQKKANLVKISKGESPQTLLKFIKGYRTIETAWCDWNIPIHWGGMSDPFQPIEREHRISLECLKVFKETQYPFIVSTKGKIIVEKEYLELLKDCNCVVQISCVCPEYNKLEPGAPSFQERVEMIRILSKYKRVQVRIQPYMLEVHGSVMNSLKLFAEAGAYGVIVEGMKFIKAKEGLIKVGADICYPLDRLQPKFEEIKNAAHSLGMKFYSGENRLRSMGDSLCCCGIDGMEGFEGNSFNINHIINGDIKPYRPKMEETGSGWCFKSLDQAAGHTPYFKQVTFKNAMLDELKNKSVYFKKMFGKDIKK